ncbi:MAG TPA: ABC transporter substrate-binding protein [Streptosporangiaceae bacterium]
MDTGKNHIDYGRLDRLRTGQGPIQEHIIDEYVAGRLSRRDFLRRGSMIGLSVPLIGGIVAACGGSTAPSGSGGTGKAGATIKAGILVPAAAINPITIADQGGLELIGNVGEFLVFTDQQFNYHPWLATSWKPNADASVWTFKIRQGVKFNDGTPMTVDDVVYSFKAQTNPKSSANALSVFGGTLSPDGVVKVDDSTVAFHLDKPDAGFPDAVSEDNYNMIIVPNNFNFADYQKSFPGTGRFMMQNYTPNVGATFVRNPHYWGKPALPEKIEFTFYPEEAPMSAALQAGAIDTMDQFSVATSPQLLTGGFSIVSLKAATHRELSMRTDTTPFTSKFVRQALAYSLDRPAIVSALFKGHAVIGNDSPFAPVFKSADTSVPQRAQNLKLAKELLARGGVPRGFKTPLLTETTQEIPHFAQVVKQAAAQIGVNIDLTIEPPSKYYGSSVFGKSDWLDGEMSLVDYGARAVPNLYLQAPLQSPNAKKGTGSWNAARFSNSTYDKLSREFIAAVDLSTQRKLAGQIERLLLDETPIIFAYFYDYLSASQKNVTGTYPTAQGQFFLWNAAKS